MKEQITQEQIEKYRMLKVRCDFDVLHHILFAGSWPLPTFLTNINLAYQMGTAVPPDEIVPYREIVNDSHKFEIQRINRMMKTGWVKIQSGHLWLTLEGVNSAPLWLDGYTVEYTKRCLKKDGVLVFKHHIRWGQRIDLLLRGTPIKTPAVKWFNPALVMLP